MRVRQFVVLAALVVGMPAAVALTLVFASPAFASGALGTATLGGTGTVVAWPGETLRCGDTTIRPVEQTVVDPRVVGPIWSVTATTRSGVPVPLAALAGSGAAGLGVAAGWVAASRRRRTREAE